MDSLIAANLRQRPMRALVSVLGVALGVVLIVINTGLIRGMLNDRIRREQSVGAEIRFTRDSGGAQLSASSANTLDTRYVDRLTPIPGVKAVSPVAVHVQRGTTGLGIEVVEGIDFNSYSAMSGLRIKEGRAFENDDEIVIDEFKAGKTGVKVGDEMQVFGKKMKVVGIYTPEISSRVKMSLGAMQRALGAPNKCLFILVKCENPNEQTAVQQRINEALPGNYVVLTRDIGLGYERSIPGLDGFVRTILVLSILVSTLVILLAMYTTITERTREIGILKSLGAPKRYIVGVIEKEAVAISAIGVVIGLIVALVTGWAMGRMTSLQLEYNPKWIVIAVLVGLAAGSLGALYPAIRAANQDPVKALAYE
ncbi:MAG TPA: FtsX-like permease family protein [Blastocatellia bacterium]|nr:FtsX-like permease family protein [Blastocatellia bacterium]